MHIGYDVHGEKNSLDKELAKELYKALANTVTFAFRAQSFHWNVRGKDFHQFHQFFEVIYDEVFEAIDPLAEHLRTLGYDAPTSLQEVINDSSIPEVQVDNDPIQMCAALNEMNEKLLMCLKTAKMFAGKMGAEVEGFIGERIAAHEKWGWQLKSIIGEEKLPVDPETLPVIPDGVILLAAAPSSCPPATQDIEINLENRKKAIDSAMYGPLNPAESNEEYWQELAGEWNVDVETARKQTCANCTMFNISPDMKDCIGEGIGDRFDQVDAAGELGYCEAFDFKCASARTCRAWVAGGPITAASLVPQEEELAEALRQIAQKHGKFNEDGTGVWAGYTPAAENEDAQIGVTCANCVLYEGGTSCSIVDMSVEPGGKCRFAVLPEGAVSTRDFDVKSVVEASNLSDQNPCWDGYEMIGMKEVDGKMVPNCVPVDSSIVYFGYETEKRLEEKAQDHNRKASSNRKTSNRVLKTVYRRGARSYSLAESEFSSREDWAIDRVDAFVRLLHSGKPLNPAYTADNDLLPESHPRHQRTVVASLEELVSDELKLPSKSLQDYTEPEQAIIAITELSGMGYGTETAVRSSWLRALSNGEDPFKRALQLATLKEESLDADLLPRFDIDAV
jgi:starvation-inducible DNA-binding protein